MVHARQQHYYEQSYSSVRRKRRGRKFLGIFAVLLLALAGFVVYVDMSLKWENALPSDGDRPADGPGANWLLVGSDSREGFNARQRAKLGTGDAAGRGTDTVMLVHIPEGSGEPTMVSLPRDSYVSVPGHGRASSMPRSPTAGRSCWCGWSRGRRGCASTTTPRSAWVVSPA